MKKLIPMLLVVLLTCGATAGHALAEEPVELVVFAAASLLIHGRI